MKIQINKFRVFERLEEKGMSKADLAKELEVTEWTVSQRYRNGWKKADAFLLAAVLEMDLEKLKK